MTDRRGAHGCKETGFTLLGWHVYPIGITYEGRVVRWGIRDSLGYIFKSFALEQTAINYILALNQVEGVSIRVSHSGDSQWNS